MTLSKLTRAELRRRCPTPEETDALLDMADERGRYRALLEGVHEYFDRRAAADCEGDPLRYVPNEEMRWKDRIDAALEGK